MPSSALQMLTLIFPRIYYCGAYPAGGTSSNLQEELKVGKKNQLNKQGKPVSDLNTENSPGSKWGPGFVAAQRSSP